MTSKILLPALLVLIATIGMAPAALATTEQQAKLFVPVESMELEALTQLSLENDRLVDIVSNEQLRVLALDNEIVLLEDNRLIAVIGDIEELQKVVPQEIPIVDMQALEVEAIAVDDRELVILEVDDTMTVLSIAQIIAPEVTPRMVELTVDAADVPFWKTTKVVIDLVDVIKTEQGVIALDQIAAEVHIFQSTQTLQYVQDAIIRDLTEIVTVPAAITEVADHIVIADNIEQQLVLVPTTELLRNNIVESAIIIPTSTTEVVEIAAVADTRADTVKIVALETDGQAQKIVLDLTHVDDVVRSVEELTLMPILATDVEVKITAIAIQEGNLLTIADNTVSTYDSLN